MSEIIIIENPVPAHALDFRQSELVYDRVCKLRNSIREFRWGKRLTAKDIHAIDNIIRYLKVMEDDIYKDMHTQS